MRQADVAFVALLNEIRLGRFTPQGAALLGQCSFEVKPLPQDDILPTKIYCINADVDAENNKELAALPSQVVEFQAKDQFVGLEVRGVRQMVPLNRRQQLRREMDRNVPEVFALKVGT
ncbi:hypothetical protein B484DRAFT_410715, partial [Ochromonadaceae sp. CCMP2298]